MNPVSLKIAAVLPRYGASVGGGAETLVRELLLSLRGKVEKISVFTTCARDHRTWENFYQEGVVFEDDIEVYRFPVSERNLSGFIAAEQKLAQGFRLDEDEQITWLENSVNSFGLYEHLTLAGSNYDVILYAPYLFGTSFWGPMLKPENAVLVPCLHDEAYAYLPVFRLLFRTVAGIMWNAKPEAELAEKIYGINDMSGKSQVVGMGFDSVVSVSGESLHPRPYVLYCGRKETGKNLDYLISCFQEYKKTVPDSFDLLLTGSGEIDFLSELPDGVYDMGFVSEEEKQQYLLHASLFIQPSVNESFSIVLMESWRLATPVLVHADCAVTSYHVSESGGGLWFRNVNEFIRSLQLIWDAPEEGHKMGIRGCAYVKQEYSWDAVHERFFRGVEKWKK